MLLVLMQIRLENRLLGMNFSRGGKDALEEEQTDSESNSENRRSNSKLLNS